jgi:macrodomain Ter protein organizer (MatP/YcbG family)
MRTTITLDEDVHEYVSNYAEAKGMTLSAAIGELIKKAESAPQPEKVELR